MAKEHKQNTKTQQKPHSSDYFVESRDHWWNQDFLELMAKRWDLSSVSSVADIGSGIGHWGRELEPYLPKYCKVIGVDQEDQWVEKATKIAHQKGLSPRFSYIKGNIYQLPFEDSSLDMVTCQTVLMHLGDPLQAIQEMKRILKPGGLLAVVEPNVAVQSLVFSSLSETISVEELLRSVDFDLRCERGKQLLGEGFNSVGDLIPGFFQKVGLENILVFVSDRAIPFIPPYRTQIEQLLLKEWEENIEKDCFAWDRETTKRYFIAGGGNEKDFEYYQMSLKEHIQKWDKAYQNKEMYCAGGGLVYLVSGRKYSIS
jgi:SAM-dependent methyltransferase